MAVHYGIYLDSAVFGKKNVAVRCEYRVPRRVGCGEGAVPSPEIDFFDFFSSFLELKIASFAAF